MDFPHCKRPYAAMSATCGACLEVIPSAGRLHRSQLPARAWPEGQGHLARGERGACSFLKRLPTGSREWSPAVACSRATTAGLPAVADTEHGLSRRRSATPGRYGEDCRRVRACRAAARPCCATVPTHAWPQPASTRRRWSEGTCLERICRPSSWKQIPWVARIPRPAWPMPERAMMAQRAQ